MYRQRAAEAKQSAARAKNPCIKSASSDLSGVVEEAGPSVTEFKKGDEISQPGVQELTRCSLFNYIAQPHKLIYALIWLHVTRTFNIIHRRGGTDRAHNYLALIEHRERNGHPIEIITLYLASLQRHFNAPSRRDFIVPRR
jgi:hypothetical protein